MLLEKEQIEKNAQKQEIMDLGLNLKQLQNKSGTSQEELDEQTRLRKQDMEKYVLYGEELKKMHDTQLQAMLEQYNVKLQQFESQLKKHVLNETKLKNEISEYKAIHTKLKNQQETLQSESILKIQENDQQIHAMWENRLSESALSFKKREVECTLKLKSAQREIE